MAEKRSEKEILLSIESKLDKLISVTAIQGKDKKTQAKILKDLGFTYKEISDLTGTPEGTVKTWDHRYRKAKK